ncbi:hypothetical protein B0H21DRAFT_720325 [Amylocystis lapponica]|nr:hypothetical protein B0H21DRAFT_720325 [Amylocystis lapponica]
MHRRSNQGAVRTRSGSRKTRVRSKYLRGAQGPQDARRAARPGERAPLSRPALRDVSRGWDVHQGTWHPAGHRRRTRLHPQCSCRAQLRSRSRSRPRTSHLPHPMPRQAHSTATRQHEPIAFACDYSQLALSPPLPRCPSAQPSPRSPGSGGRCRRACLRTPPRMLPRHLQTVWMSLRRCATGAAAHPEQRQGGRSVGKLVDVVR